MAILFSWNLDNQRPFLKILNYFKRLLYSQYFYLLNSHLIFADSGFGLPQRCTKSKVIRHCFGPDNQISVTSHYIFTKTSIRSRLRCIWIASLIFDSFLFVPSHYVPHPHPAWNGLLCRPQGPAGGPQGQQQHGNEWWTMISPTERIRNMLAKSWKYNFSHKKAYFWPPKIHFSRLRPRKRNNTKLKCLVYERWM